MSYLSAGRRPKKVTKTMNEMPSTTRAMVAMVPILKSVGERTWPEISSYAVVILVAIFVVGY